MKDDELAALGLAYLFVFIFIFSSFGFFNLGAYFMRKTSIYETTINCIEKSQECKERYNYYKLGEKLGGNK